VVKPEAFVLPSGMGDCSAAGNVFTVYGPRLSGLPQGTRRIEARPLATALLRLAPQLLAQGRAVPAAQALPTYVRDKVAQTTAERAAIKAAAAFALTAS
jgi:tRNA threonylcarbamoyladenosine biosynthesis protein TsaB